MVADYRQIYQKGETMYRLDLTDNNVAEIAALLRDLSARYQSVEDSDFLNDLAIYAHALPIELRIFLSKFKFAEPAGVCLVSGYPINDVVIGDTPAHWKDRSGVSPALEQELLFMLCAALLGEPFGWATQQDGYIMNDVLPIKGHEDEQIGTGSGQTIWWHTEDAFHPYKGDYVGLMCLRNPESVPTTFAAIDSFTITDDVKETLFEPLFVINPDESHRKGYEEGGGQSRRIAELLSDPPKVPVLSGNWASPYMCLDPYFMDIPQDERAKAALDALTQEIDRSIDGIILQPGDICFIDNYRAVHGRKAFRAKFDGRDRWLKRLNVTHDLRKSRDARPSPTSRVIG